MKAKKKQSDPDFIGTIRALMIARPLSIEESYRRGEQRRGKSLDEILGMISREKPIILRVYHFFPADGVKIVIGDMPRDALEVFLAAKTNEYRAERGLDGYGYAVVKLYRRHSQTREEKTNDL